MNFDRRNFFTSIALGVGATAFPNFIKDFDKLKPVNISSQLNDQTASEWFKNIKGEHRVVYDGSQPHNTLPITWNWAFLESNNSVGVEDSNMTAMTVLRHSGIVYAFNSDIWNKFKLGELVSFNDNKTGKPSLRNTVMNQKQEICLYPQYKESRIFSKEVLCFVCVIWQQRYMGLQ